MSSFKVLISGGSLVGLTLALALERAGIDFEVFEKSEIGPQLGASIALHSQSVRILEQLGVWKDIAPTVTRLERIRRLDANDGRVVEESFQLREISRVLRWPFFFIERRRLLQVLYEHIRDKSKVHDHTAVVSYEEADDGVVVTTNDGCSFRGDVLVGADGIHSRVRAVMLERISRIHHAAGTEIDQAFTTSYQALFGISRHDPSASDSFLPDGQTVYNVYGDNYSAIVATSPPDLVFWFLFIKTGRTQDHNTPRYTDEDAQAAIDRYGGTALGRNHTLRELWDTRIRATLVPMEDGIVKQWSHRRVLLLGDSAHKVTINAGLGGNLALEAVTHFTNGLVSLLKEKPQAPSLSDLSTLFERFDRVHRPRAEVARTISAKITQTEAQETWFLRFHARYISPWFISDRTKSGQYLRFAWDAPWLEFVPLPSRDADLLDRREKGKRWTQSITNWWVFGSGAALATATVAAIWWRYRR